MLLAGRPLVHVAAAGEHVAAVTDENQLVLWRNVLSEEALKSALSREGVFDVPSSDVVSLQSKISLCMT